MTPQQPASANVTAQDAPHTCVCRICGREVRQTAYGPGHASAFARVDARDQHRARPFSPLA